MRSTRRFTGCQCARQQLYERQRSFGVAHDCFEFGAVSDLRFRPPRVTPVLRTNEPVGPEIDIAGLVTFGRPMGEQRTSRKSLSSELYVLSHPGKHYGRPAEWQSHKAASGLPDGFDGVYLFGSLQDFLAGNPDQFRQAFGNSNVDFGNEASADSCRIIGPSPAN